MEISEAIKHAREVASKYNNCSRCSKDHNQLADWLEELVRLRAELARVTAERDKIAQYELEAWGEYCFGDSSTGIPECEWLDSNGRCKLKEWAEGRKETDRE